MSIHPSLGSSIKHKRQKSVLKRTERLKILSEKGEWKEDESVFGLPKVKTVKIKIKKEKAAKPAEAAGTEGAPEGGTVPSEKLEKPEKPAKSEKPEKS